MAMLFGSSFAQSAFESAPLESGVFGYYLREAFAGKASDRDGAVTIVAAFESASNHMRVDEQLKQTPVIWFNLDRDPVITNKNMKWNKVNQKRIAVFVGIDKYADSRFPPLSFAESDANKMAHLLTDVGGFDGTILIGREATRYRICTTVSRLVGTLKKGDLFLFYFSGHGYSTRDQGYALVYDTQLDLPDASLTTRTGLSVSDITSLARSGTAQQIIFIFDANMAPEQPIA